MADNIIATDRAPGAVGAYSQGKIAGNLIFTSGQIALDPETCELNDSTFSVEARQVLENLQAVIEAGGGSLHSVVKTTVFLTDLSHYGELNELYESFFGEGLPARSVVEVQALPKDVRLEIEAVAVAE